MTDLRQHSGRIVKRLTGRPVARRATRFTPFAGDVSPALTGTTATLPESNLSK